MCIFAKRFNMDILSQIQFEDPSQGNGIIKATIHKSGKLGFSAAAQAFLNLNEKSFFKVGFNEDPTDTNIYLVPSLDDVKAFKAAKAGDYYYINLKNIFDKRGLDYQNQTIIYDIKRPETTGLQYYILTKRK